MIFFFRLLTLSNAKVQLGSESCDVDRCRGVFLAFDVGVNALFDRCVPGVASS